MAGEDDRIQGYNPIYRSENISINFYSFDLNNNRPTKFINRIVNVIDNPNAPILDHQGHIVPQNILNIILDPLMDDMAKECNNLEEAKVYINNHNQWMTDVYDYGFAIGAPMFDFSEEDPENKVGGFFSIVTWNPINICRAPSDKERDGVPGNNIDTQVTTYLKNNKEAQGVDQEWLDSLEQLIEEPDNRDYIENYITKCSATLADQINAGIGYYAFPWVSNDDILSPQ